jgi:hypothetical protein
MVNNDDPDCLFWQKISTSYIKTAIDHLRVFFDTGMTDHDINRRRFMCETFIA